MLVFFRGSPLSPDQKKMPRSVHHLSCENIWVITMCQDCLFLLEWMLTKCYLLYSKTGTVFPLPKFIQESMPTYMKHRVCNGCRSKSSSKHLVFWYQDLQLPLQKNCSRKANTRGAPMRLKWTCQRQLCCLWRHFGTILYFVFFSFFFCLRRKRKRPNQD